MESPDCSLQGSFAIAVEEWLSRGSPCQLHTPGPVCLAGFTLALAACLFNSECKSYHHCACGKTESPNLDALLPNLLEYLILVYFLAVHIVSNASLISSRKIITRHVPFATLAFVSRKPSSLVIRSAFVEFSLCSLLLTTLPKSGWHVSPSPARTACLNWRLNQRQST